MRAGGFKPLTDTDKWSPARLVWRLVRGAGAWATGGPFRTNATATLLR